MDKQIRKLLLSGMIVCASCALWAAGSAKSAKPASHKPSSSVPSQAKRSVTFAVLGDVHLGLRGEDGFKMTADSERIFEIAIEQLNKIPDLSFVVFDGDLVIDGESFNLARFKEMADGLNVPYYVVFGNHDQPVVPSKEQWNPATRAFYPGETKATVAALFRGHGFSGDGQTWWSADRAGIHLIGLDSTQVASWGGVIPKQELDWLQKDLKEGHSPTLIFLHHNLHESYPEYKFPAEFLVSNRDPVKALIRSARQVKAVIAAHYHFSDYHTEDGVQYFTTSSVNTYPLRFSVFEMTPSTIHMRTISIVDSDTHHEEADTIQKLAKDLLARDPFWSGMVRTGLGGIGKPPDAEAVQTRLLEMFEANPSSPELPLRSAR